MPTKERVSGLCRVDCARGESKGLRDGPKNLITRASIGIIRQSALCLLYGKEMKSALLFVRCVGVPEEEPRTRIDRDIPLMYVEDRDSLERLNEAAKQCRKTRTWP